jgi:hypothetical protein
VNGEPAAGVTIALYPLQQQYYPPNPSTVLRVKSDVDGRFCFIGVVGGRYFITALALGCTSSDDNVYGFGARGKSLNVSESESVEDVEIALRRGSVITGRVIDAQGRPLTDQSVTITAVNKDGAGRPFYDNSNYEMFNIDDRGVYRLCGLPEGRYLISVGFAPVPGITSIQSNRMFYPRTFHPDTTDEKQAKFIEVTEGSETTGVDITVGELKKAYDVFGRVVNADTGQPAPGMDLVYYSVMEDGQSLGGDGGNGERSDAKGEFQLSAILPGKYAICTRQVGDSDLYGEPTICDVR